MTEGEVLFFETFEITRMILSNTSDTKRTSLTNVPGSTNRLLVYNDVLFSKGRKSFRPSSSVFVIPLCFVVHTIDCVHCACLSLRSLLDTF